MHCEFLHARPYLHWIPLVPSQGNCLPVVFAGTALPPFGAELAAGSGSGAGFVAGAAGRGIMGKSPGCGINSSCCGGAKVPAFPKPGMSAVGFTIPACKGGGGGTGGGIPATIPGIDIALALKATRHAYLILQSLNPSATNGGGCFLDKNQVQRTKGTSSALRTNQQVTSHLYQLSDTFSAMFTRAELENYQQGGLVQNPPWAAGFGHGFMDDWLAIEFG